jgi:hypothetical protein
MTRGSGSQTSIALRHAALKLVNSKRQGAAARSADCKLGKPAFTRFTRYLERIGLKENTITLYLD